MQDINVYISLDTKIAPKETLMPLILTLEGEASFKEYASLAALTADFAATTAAGKAAKAMFDQAKLAGAPPAKVAVLGLSNSATNDDITDALDALRDVNDDWYYLVPAAATDAQITALATWAAATVLNEDDIAAGVKEGEKLLVAQTSASTLSLTSAQTVLCYNPEASTTMMHAAWVGRMAPYYPDAITWKWKELAGVDSVDVDGTALTTLLGKHYNTYINNHKRNYMRDGVCCDGEYIDVVIARWQLKQYIRKAVADFMVDNTMVPYDDSGFAMVGSVVIGALQRGADCGIIRKRDGKPVFTVTIPTYADATEAQIDSRTIPDILWMATLLGGIHGVKVNGTLSIRLPE